MARNQTDNIIESDIKNDFKSNFKCMSEVYEDGKLFHFLYNPVEKDTLKAWKKSTECVS